MGRRTVILPRTHTEHLPTHTMQRFLNKRIWLWAWRPSSRFRQLHLVKVWCSGGTTSAADLPVFHPAARRELQMIGGQGWSVESSTSTQPTIFCDPHGRRGRGRGDVPRRHANNFSPLSLAIT